MRGSSPEGRPPDLLGLLAHELARRVEALLDKRNGESGPQSPDPDDRWLKVSEVAEQVGAPQEGPAAESSPPTFRSGLPPQRQATTDRTAALLARMLAARLSAKRLLLTN